MFKILYNTFCYDNKSIINSTVSTWNHFQTIFHGHNLLHVSPKKLNHLFLNIFLRTMKNSLCVSTIIIITYLMYDIFTNYEFAYICLYMCICMFVYMHICMYIYVCIFFSILCLTSIYNIYNSRNLAIVI